MIDLNTQSLYDSSNAFSLLTFTWLTPLIKKLNSIKSVPNQSDLFPLSDIENPVVQTDKMITDFFHNKSTFKVLFKSISKYFWIGLSCQIIYILSRFLTSWFLYNALKKLEAKEMDNQALLDCLYVAFGLIIGNFAYNHASFAAERVANTMKFNIISWIYEKISKVESRLLDDKKISSVVEHLIANSGSKLYSCFGLITSPLAFFLSLWILWAIFGRYSLFGIVIYLLLIPIQMLFLWNEQRQKAKASVYEQHGFQKSHEFLENIRYLKMMSWQRLFADSINNKKLKENKMLNSAMTYSGMNRSLTHAIVLIASFMIFLPFSIHSGQLTAAMLFATLYVVDQLRWNFAMTVGEGYTNARQFKQIVSIVDQIVQLPELKYLQGNPTNPENSIEIENFALQQGRQDDQISTDQNEPLLKVDSPQPLNTISLQIKKGQLIGLIGKNGSGKTSLLRSIIGEIDQFGEVRVLGNLSYVSQNPSIFQGTLKENITFGNQYNDRFFHEIIELCELKEKMPCEIDNLMEDEYKTFSSSTMAQISLARALYSKADIYVFDEIFEALDLQLGERIFQNGILNYLKGSTILLSTHQSQYMAKLDRILILNEKKIIEDGAYTELIKEPNISIRNYIEYQPLHDKLQHQLLIEPISNKKNRQCVPKENLGNIICRSTKSGKPQTIALFGFLLRSYPSFVTKILLLILFVIAEVFFINFGRSLMFWVDGSRNQREIVVALGSMIIGYFMINLLKNIFWFHSNFANSSKLHRKAYINLSQTKIECFDNSFNDKVLRKLQNAFKVLEIAIPNNLIEGFNYIFYQAALLITVCVISPILILPSILMLILVYQALNYTFKPIYWTHNLQLKAQQSIPATIQPQMSTIRVYKQKEFFRKKFSKSIENLAKASVYNTNLKRSLRFFIDCASNLCVIISLFVFFSYGSDLVRESIAVFAAAFILLSSQFFSKGLLQLIDSELLLQQLEPIYEVAQLPKEDYAESRQVGQSHKWLPLGKIQFQNFKSRGSQEEINFTINEGEKVAIFDRKGDTQKAIINQIFRFQENQGSIKIDGVSIESLSLQQLRRNMAIIPQNKKIFTAKIRKNLDFGHQKWGDELWQALAKVGIQQPIKDFENTLRTKIDNQTDILSEEQKILIGVARGMMRKSRIVVLDECEEYIDAETEFKIHEIILKKFRGHTVLSVPNRITSLIGYDKIIVAEDGRVQEVGALPELLNNPNSVLQEYFNKLYQYYGVDNFNELMNKGI